MTSTADLLESVESTDSSLASYALAPRPHFLVAGREWPKIVRVGGWMPGVIFFGFCFTLLGALQIAFYMQYSHFDFDNLWILKTSGSVFLSIGIALTIAGITICAFAHLVYRKGVTEKERSVSYVSTIDQISSENGLYNYGSIGDSTLLANSTVTLPASKMDS